MKIIEYIKNVTKFIKIISTLSYHYIKYKLNLETYNNTVVNVCNSLVSHSYIFIKIIQWGMQNVYNLNFDEELTYYFNTFSNNVPYTEFELKQTTITIHNTIEFCNNALEIENHYIPINSGSVALIFKGLLNGKPVIIKALRPNIKNTIVEDVKHIQYLFDNIVIKSIIKHYMNINSTYLKNCIENIYESLVVQCDFTYEVNNALLFKKNLENKKNIIIPHIYKEFTDNFNEIIVMEYVNGPVAKNVSSIELKKHFETIRSIYLESLFRYNILHGDFHLGNVMIVNTTTIGIIDFGIVYQVTNEISDELFNIIFLNMNKKKKKNFFKMIKIFIRIICIDKANHEDIFIKIKNENIVLNEVFNSKFSGTLIILIMNKLMSMDIELNKNIINLMFSMVSGLQTLENCVTHIDDDNKSLTTAMKSYMKINFD